MKKHTNFTNEIESPLNDTFADTITNLALYVGIPLAVGILLFDTFGGADLLLWLTSKI